MTKYVALAAAVALVSTTSLPATDKIDLRGYGTVSAELQPARALFECQSVEKADLLLGKLLADLFWDSQKTHTQQKIRVGSRELTAHLLPGQGAALIARSGASVLVIGAPQISDLAPAAEREPLLRSADVTTESAKLYPAYLDFFDLKALKFYVHPMVSVKNEGMENHWPFAQKFGANLTFQYIAPNFANPAPGVVSWSAFDYEVKSAERFGGTVIIGPSGGGEVPFWVANRYPQYLMAPSSTTLLGEWGGAAMAATKYESWAMPREVRMQTGLGFLRDTMERYRNSPALGGWHMYGGAPGVEFGFHDGATMSWDQSPAGQQLWQHYLRDVEHHSLVELGTRWFGDAKRFASWDQVTVPNNHEFFGPLNNSCLVVREGWRYISASADQNIPPTGDAAWTAIDMPPSQAQAFLPAADRFFSVSINTTEWMKLNHGKPVWLVFAATGVGNDAVRLWINGNAVAMPTDNASKNGPFAVSVEKLLTSGDNQLIVRMKSARETDKARISGPVFLTAQEPKRPPFMDRGTNARFADYRAWQAWAMYENHRDMLTMARAIDPDRPFVLSGAARSTFDFSSALATEYGMGCQHTGREAWYHPWWPGLGMVAGFYGTSEPSATARGDKLDRLFGWLMIDGDSSHTLFWDIEDYMKEEKQNGWFTRHQRQLQLVGKYLRQRPDVVLFRSAQTIRMGIDTPWSWDLGRGELQMAHYDNAYATERELAAGLVRDYPVLIDTGSEIMDPPVVESLRKYIENGGTFVAFHNTGRHTSLQADENPLRTLSGFKLQQRKGPGRLTFGKDLPILQSLAGKSFEGSGTALDYVQLDSAKDGASLERVNQAAQALAHWNDGSIAVGYRKVGKGRVVVLGSTFWRHGKDSQGLWRTASDIERNFLEQLLSDCGVQRNATSGNPDVWCRAIHFKNGLMSGAAAFNSASAECVTDVKFRLDSRPEQVINLMTQAPIPFDYTEGWVTLAAQKFAPYDVQMYGVSCGSIVKGLPTWWGEKTRYWKRNTPQTGAPEWMKQSTPPADRNVLPMAQWLFKADADGELVRQGQWSQPAFKDSDWVSTTPGLWSITQAVPAGYQGAGLYRTEFSFSAAEPGAVLLNLYSFDTPVAYDASTWYVNGQQVATTKARRGSQTYQIDVTQAVHPGRNVLAVAVSGGKSDGGLAGAVWIERRAPLSPALSLNDAWKAVATGQPEPVAVKIPGTGKGQSLRAAISIPREWSGCRVMMDMVLREQDVAIVVINGRPIAYNSYAHPFGARPRINLTPYVKFGQENQLEIWAQSTVTRMSEDPTSVGVAFRINDIMIGCESDDLQPSAGSK